MTLYTMKDPFFNKNQKVKHWSLTTMLLGSRVGMWHKLYFNAGVLCLVSLSAFIIILCKDNSEDIPGMFKDYKDGISASGNRLLRWNYTSYNFEPSVSDWDKQRAAWLNEHQGSGLRQNGAPNVLMVTGSNPNPCEPSVASHIMLKAAKNKIDYCRIHDIQLFYSLGNPNPEFSDWWAKLPLIRMLMLQHPEAEWIWWLDADAIFTDMTFEPPFADLKRYNLILYGSDELVYKQKDWTGVNTGDYFIRNCQWSLDLLDVWASMGRTEVKAEAGKFLSDFLKGRPSDFLADDQSALVSLLTQRGTKKWIKKVKLVTEMEYSLSGNWLVSGQHYEEMVERHHPGLGDYRWPLVTHFAGCQPCRPEFSSQPWDVCLEQMQRTFDFADNQVYQLYGFKPRPLGTEGHLTMLNAISMAAEEDQPFHIQPQISLWDEQRRAWMEKHKEVKPREVILVSGSSPKSCARTLGNHILLRVWMVDALTLTLLPSRGLKNKIDYGRIHNVEFFYNMAILDAGLKGWWSKLPTLRMLMLNHPEVEWFWWMDSDAVFSNMAHKIPFERYNALGYNFVMYGDDRLVFEEKSYSGINTGNFLIRNCQWSFDLLDRWASFGATEELATKNEELLSLLDRPRGWAADDQSVLVYMLVTEREKWRPNILLEKGFVMSGDWIYWTARFDTMKSEERPFVTHFAGCQPCVESPHEECLGQMDRTFNFADNQVLKNYGLRHGNLSTTYLQRDNVREIHDLERSTSPGKDSLSSLEDGGSSTHLRSRRNLQFFKEFSVPDEMEKSSSVP